MQGEPVTYAPVWPSIARVRASYLPPPDLKVSEFADAHLIVTSGPLAGTRWRTDFAPYQRGILDAFHEPGVETVVVQGSSQWGKTACAVAVVAYHIGHDPCPILVVEPTVEPMARDFAKNRLDTVIEATPLLREAVSRKRTKGASNTTLAKTYRGGSLAVGGANSASSLASRPVRLLVLDEVDRYPAELPGEGSTLAIAMKRTQSFKRRRRVLMLSSPTLEGAPIDVWFQRGDRRRYFVPCPDCGHMHPYEWRNLKWDHDDPMTARLECPACEYAIGDAQRVAILSRGEWRPTGPPRSDSAVVSFHLWEAYSPLSSLREIVAGFIRARELQKRGDSSEMHTWQNTTLGEPLPKAAGEGVEPLTLLDRRAEWAPDIDVPAFACCLTAGVDTQDDRLEVLVVAWGPGEESAFVDRHTFDGDPDRPEVWRMLDDLLTVRYRHPTGQTLMIHSTCVDSGGHRTTAVYDYVERRAGRRVYAVIGRDGKRPVVSDRSQKRRGQDDRKVDLRTVGVDAAKQLWMDRLAVTEHGPGYVHLPAADWCTEEFVAQLTAEQLVTTWHKGIPSKIWRKVRARNEALDCAVYALAALRVLNAKLGPMLLALRALPPPPPPRPDAPKVTPPPARSRVLGHMQIPPGTV